MNKGKDATIKQNKKQSSWVRFFLTVAIIIGLGYVIFNYVPFIAKYDHYVIVTNSMEPTIMVGDVVIIDSSVMLDDLEEGQIIAFYTDISNPEDGVDEIVVHYLYSITEENDVKTYRTVSESGIPDPWTLNEEDILGIHVLTISKVGPLLLFAQSPFGKIILIADIFIIYILIELFSGDKKKDNKKKLEKELENTEEEN